MGHEQVSWVMLGWGGVGWVMLGWGGLVHEGVGQIMKE